MTQGAMRRYWSTLWVTRFQRWGPRHQETHGRCADTLAEVKAEPLGNTWGAAQPPVDKVAASRAEEDVQTLDDTLSDATHW